MATAQEMKAEIERQSKELTQVDTDLDARTSHTAPPGDQAWEYETEEEPEIEVEEEDDQDKTERLVNEQYDLTDEEVEEILMQDPLIRNAKGIRQEGQRITDQGGYSKEDEMILAAHQQMFNNALAEDVAALADRYGPADTEEFMRSVKYGRVKFKPEDITLANPLEQRFLDWYGAKPGVTAGQLKRIITIASQNPPLPCRAADTAMPGMRLKKAEPKFIPKNLKAKKVTYRDFDTLEPAEIEEALKDYLVKRNPKRYRR